MEFNKAFNSSVSKKMIKKHMEDSRAFEAYMAQFKKKPNPLSIVEPLVGHECLSPERSFDILKGRDGWELHADDQVLHIIHCPYCGVKLDE